MDDEDYPFELALARALEDEDLRDRIRDARARDKE